MKLRTAIVVVAAVVLLASVAAQPVSGAGADAALDSIRRDLAELRFEKALVGIETLLAEPLLTEEERVETLILRAQAHASYGDLDAVEKDYREILSRRPAYVPDATLTPPKAMVRFDKVQKTMVGSVRLTVTPDDATVFIDGRQVLPAPDGVFRALAGNRVVRVERGGFDSVDAPVVVKAGATASLEIRLIPNARTVVVRTDPAGVEVKLDGVPVGTTERPYEAANDQPAAELTVPNVSLGDHVFELSKPCYRTMRMEDFVTVDINDFTPRVYKPVTMQRSHAQLILEGGPAGAEVHVDGQPQGLLPLDTLNLCPGKRVVEVRQSGRIVWRSEEMLPTDGEATVRLAPRPNVTLVGTEGWPSDLWALQAEVSTLGTVSLRDTRRLDRAAGWEKLELPDGTDLALTVLPPEEDGSPERWLLYSPLLRRVERIDGEEFASRRPEWAFGTIRINLVDSRVGGSARVARVAPGGPAATAGIVPGDRLIAIGGEPVQTAERAMRAIRSFEPGTTLEIELESARGDRSKVKIKTVSSPRLFSGPEREGPAGLIIAAWSSVDGVTAGERTRPAAMANLALLLGDAGRHRTALETWRRVRWGSRSGVGEGTTAYYVGRNLVALAREQDALEAFERAEQSEATTFGDDGPPVAPAAADHLIDLGVSPD